MLNKSLTSVKGKTREEILGNKESRDYRQIISES